MERFIKSNPLFKISDLTNIRLLIIVPLYVLCIFPNHYSAIIDDEIFREYLFLFYFGITGTLIISIIVFNTIYNREQYSFTLSKFDLIFIVILIFNIFNTLIISDHHINGDHFLVLEQFITYLLIKNLLSIIKKDDLKYFTNNLIVIVSFIFFGLVIYGTLQIIGFIDSKSKYFIVTGQFSNPARFAMFCSLLMPYPLMWSIYDGRIKVKLIVYLMIFLFLIVIYFTGIQTVWIGSLIVITLVAVRNYTIKKETKLCFILLALLFISAIIIFVLFSNSGQGRLLIWKVSLDIFLDNPIFGVGLGNFENIYTTYQSKHFINNYLYNEIFYSDVIRYPYNEYIKILCEQGILGFILFLILIYKVIKSKIFQFSTSENSYLSYCSLLVLILGITFTLFSYPSNDPAISTILMLSVCFLSLNDKNTLKIKLNTVTTIPILVCTICFFLHIMSVVNQQIEAYAQWKKGRCYDLEDEELTTLYKKLSNDQLFVEWYSNLLIDEGNPIKAAETIEQNNEIIRTPKLFIILAKSFILMKDFNKAEDALITAVNIAPNRFLPRLHLMNFYQDLGEVTKCVQEAKKIMSLPIKIYSDDVNFVKKKAFTILQTN